MKKVFLDTNLLLDLIDLRPGYEETARILQKNTDGIISCAVSYLSMANIAYVLRKRTPGFTIPCLKQISAVLTVLPMDNAQLQEALFIDGPDFEDILQAECALKNGCDCIVSRNTKHFHLGSALITGLKFPPVYTPVEFLSSLEQA